ncbi:hypothetical protein DZF93_19550, partial [Clavibacter michiganensis subsp. insidiosus]
MGEHHSAVRRASTRGTRTASTRARLVAAITGLSLGVTLLVAVEPGAAPAQAATTGTAASSARVIAPGTSE